MDQALASLAVVGRLRLREHRYEMEVVALALPLLCQRRQIQILAQPPQPFDTAFPGWRVRTEVHTRIACTADVFIVSAHLQARRNPTRRPHWQADNCGRRWRKTKGADRSNQLSQVFFHLLNRKLSYSAEFLCRLA